MYVDATQFPVVRMYNEGHAIEQTFEQITGVFEDILARDMPYVMIGIGTDRPKKRQDPAENKRAGLWIKHNKHRFKLCRKMVIVEPSAVKRVTMGTALSLFAKFWGFSVELVPSEEEALSTAKAVLADAGASTSIHSAEEAPSKSS